MRCGDYVTGLAALGLLVLGAAPARAHAYPDHSAPPADSMLATPPQAVSIWFTQAIEPAYSGVEVTDAHGQPVASEAAAVDANNPALLRVRLKPLPPGRYTVTWHVTAVDSHASQGSFDFTVAP